METIKKQYAIFHRDTKDFCSLSLCNEAYKNLIEEADDKKAQFIEIKEELIKDKGFDLESKYIFTYVDDSTVKVEIRESYNPLETKQRKLIQKIKQECKRRIYEKYPNYKQRNIDRTAWILLKKNINGRVLQNKELDEVQIQETMHNFIENLRCKSNELEDRINLMSLEEIENLDVAKLFEEV
jgi:hypothetical protein